MYRNARALDPDVLPEQLEHRGAALRELTDALGPLRDGRSARPARVEGPSGVGKTTVARFAVRQLQTAGTSVREAYVNVFSDRTRAGVFYRACAELGRAARFDRRTPAAQLREELETAAARRPVVVIVDEAAHIRSGDHVVYRELYELSNVAAILVDRDLDHLFAECEQSTASRLREGPRVSLSKYGHAELLAILRARVRAALHDPARISEEALELIAETVDGNAREGIVLLRAAIEAVDGTGAPVTRETVTEVEPRARERLYDRALGRLDSRHRTLYTVLRDHGPMDGATLHDRLEDALHGPVAPRTRRRWLSYLRELGLVRKDGAGRATTYQAVSPGGVSATPSA